MGGHGNPLAYKRAQWNTTPAGGRSGEARAQALSGSRSWGVSRGPHRGGTSPPDGWDRRSFDLDRCSCPLELGLGLLGLLLGHLLQDGLGGAVDQVLGLLEAQVGEGAHLLD